MAQPQYVLNLEEAARMFIAMYHRAPTQLELLDYVLNLVVETYGEIGLSRSEIGPRVRQLLARGGL